MNEDDLKERVDGFNEGLKSLLGKYELVLGATASITPDGRVMAEVRVGSSRENKEEAIKVDFIAG